MSTSTGFTDSQIDPRTSRPMVRFVCQYDAWHGLASCVARRLYKTTWAMGLIESTVSTRQK